MQLFAKVQADEAGKMGDVLVMLARDRLPLPPGRCLRIARRPPRLNQGKLRKLGGGERLSQSSDQGRGRNDQEFVPRQFGRWPLGPPLPPIPDLNLAFAPPHAPPPPPPP